MTDVKDWNTQVIEEFRSNHGKVGGPFEGAPVLLLTSTGAKTGKQRTSPVMYLQDGDRLLVFASKAGAPTNPDWYHNLLTNPTVTVEVGDDKFEANATPLQGEERDRFFNRQAELYPGFREYQEKTTRTIPVVALTKDGQRGR